MFFYFKPFDIYFDNQDLFECEISIFAIHIGKYAWDLFYIRYMPEWDIFQLIIFGFKIKGEI